MGKKETRGAHWASVCAAYSDKSHILADYLLVLQHLSAGFNDGDLNARHCFNHFHLLRNGIAEEKSEQQAWSASLGRERQRLGGTVTHQVVITAERAPSNEHGRLAFRHAR